MPSTPVCMIGMMIVSGYLFKKMSENPLPSGFLSRHGVKEKHQPLYQKLVLTMAQKEGFVSPHSTLVGPLGSKAALRPHSPPRGSNPSAPPNFLCKNKRDSDFSKSLSWRRRRDLNPRAATNDLLPFQGSPFSHLGTSAFMAESHSFKESDIQFAAPDPVLPDSAIQ